MINFSDGLCWKAIDSVEKHPEILEFIRKRRFRVSDTQLSYRQINSLEASDVLENSRENESGWRLFSLKDLLFLQMIANTRKYGVTNEMLKMLKEHLYLKKDDSELFKSKYDIFYGEYAIIAILFGVRVGWMLYEDGKSTFTDMEGLIMMNGGVKPESKSFLYLNVNEILKGVFRGSRIEKILPEQPSLADIIRSYMNSSLTEKEIEILDIIRNKDYTKITIVKKESGDVNVYGESQKDAKDIKEKDILKLFEDRSFSNIKVQKRDGKVVTYSIEDVYKI